MSLKVKISEDIKNAMKEKNTIKLSVLRVLKGEIERNEQSASGKIDLSDADIIKIVKKMVESIKETTNNQDEILSLEGYLPKQLTAEELELSVRKLKEAGHSNMGEIMKYFKLNHDGTYDGKVLSEVTKKVLA